MMKYLYSEDPSIIREWAKEAYSNKLYREDGLAQYSLSGQGRIYRMFYIPEVAWLMYCDYVSLERIGMPRWQAFVRSDMRRQGICSFLWNIAIVETNIPIPTIND